MAVNRRFLVVHLPAFRLERCGYGPDDPVALVGERSSGGWRASGSLRSGATRLVVCSTFARSSGLRPGMTATEARALAPDVELVPWDPAGEEEDRASLRARFEALSDRVNHLGDPAWPDALVVELTHVARGRELEWAQHGVSLARELGHACRAAVADDPLAARAVAEWSAPDDGAVVVPVGGGREQLGTLPVAALITAEDLRESLVAVGVDTVGQWAALDPAAVASRYGPTAARLHRVARGGCGGLVELSLPTEDGAPIARASLPGATTRQELGFVLVGLLAELSERLAARDLAAVRLRVVLHLDAPDEVGVAFASFTVRVGRATRSPRALGAQIRARLDRFTVSAPIDELTIEVTETAPEAAWQPGLADRAEASEPLPDLLARLADQLGDESLFSPVLADRWRPEHAWGPGAFPRATLTPSRPVRTEDPVELQESHERAFPLPRPTLLLPKPERLEVEGERPARIRTPAGWRPVTRCAGPERLWGEWWASPPLDRTYWVVEVEGRALWVYRDGTGWWHHGWFD